MNLILHIQKTRKLEEFMTNLIHGVKQDLDPGIEVIPFFLRR